MLFFSESIVMLASGTSSQPGARNIGPYAKSPATDTSPCKFGVNADRYFGTSFPGKRSLRKDNHSLCRQVVYVSPETYAGAPNWSASKRTSKYDFPRSAISCCAVICEVGTCLNIGFRNAFKFTPVKIKMKNIRNRESDRRIEAAFIVSTKLCNAGFVRGDEGCVTVMPQGLEIAVFAKLRLW